MEEQSGQDVCPRPHPLVNGGAELQARHSGGALALLAFTLYGPIMIVIIQCHYVYEISTPRETDQDNKPVYHPPRKPSSHSQSCHFPSQLILKQIPDILSSHP